MKDEKPIVFKTEDSIWQTLADGTKTFDYRLYDIDDERIYRLSRGKFDTPSARQPGYLPVETFVHFRNVLTEEMLQFRYRGMEFVSWAPGWCFLQLGGLVRRGFDSVFLYEEISRGTEVHTK